MQSFDVLILGTGAAGYAVAERLLSLGVKDIAILAEYRKAGTSRNAGSDKQTYYKLSCTNKDSPTEMAKAYFAGGSMHGDHALIESANSLSCFMHLAELGVPFPQDEFGRYVGYQTDHDEAKRGSSAGPLTSKYMTELLEKKVLANENVTLLDGYTLLQIVTEQNVAHGVLALRNENDNAKIEAIAAEYIVAATGGAASMYKKSVFPASQTGALGVLADAGCALQNITEWQYGLASTKVRWNVSGSYQQVIPTYLAQKPDGTTYEFLENYFDSLEDAYNNVFLKGYQWPFDSRKLAGSSKVDLAVSEELAKGNRVFMDFRSNPKGYAFEALSEETKTYLKEANAVDGAPIDRLLALNKQAYDFYKNHKIDLKEEALEIAVCAQHQNGGVAVDTHYQSSVQNLFVIGEACGVFGMYRPGGSALNDTQVGALRVAQYIKSNQKEHFDLLKKHSLLREAESQEKAYCTLSLETDTPMLDFTGDMSLYAGAFRILDEIAPLYQKVKAQKESHVYHLDSLSHKDVKKLYMYRNTISAQEVFLRTLLATLQKTGSRGGSICQEGGTVLKENESYRAYVIQTTKENVTFEPVRPLPNTDYNFETVWHAYNEKMGI